MVTTFWYCFRR